jgi:hypothetical protein
VRESDREGGNGHYTVSHWGDGKIAPCWELYVQLADYSRLRAAADARGLTVRLEDRQMDITVWAGCEFVLYVENKETKAQATSLLARMREYGVSGFDLDAPDKGNDPLRKAKYLFCYEQRPRYFALSAVNYVQLFLIEYQEDGHRFRLVDVDGDLTMPLFDVIAQGQAPVRSVADALTIEMEQYGKYGVWVSQGTGQTAINVYLPCERGDAIALGVYKNGEVWTDFKKLGHLRVQRLAQSLNELEIVVDATKEWGFWMSWSSRFILDHENAPQVATAVVKSVIPDAEIA